MMKRGTLTLVVFAFLILIAFAGAVDADAVFVQHSQPDFSNYYRAEGRISTYYPILGQDPDSCIAREDVILQIAPAGCQPAVVRSDILAEQNVPVFCQIDAIKTNPLLDIEQIRNIRLSVAEKSEGVSGVGFHPARAALRTNDILLGSPVEDNIGYAVVVLKREPNEALLPKSVNVTLKARLDYYAGNALGIGRSEFLLQEMSDEKWESEKVKQSFFRGQYSVRLIDAEPERARVAVYSGDKIIQNIVLDREKGAEEIFIPGSYCRVALDMSYDGFFSASRTALLNVDGDNVEVYKGSKFLDGKCSIRDINLKGEHEGSVDISCGGEKFELKLRPVNYEINEEVVFINGTAGHEKYGQEYKFWTIKEIKSNGNLTISREGQDIEVLPGWIKSIGSEKLYEADYDADIDEYFDKTINEYTELADVYPFEKETAGDESYAEQGLRRAIFLSEKFNKRVTEQSLLEKFEELYPDKFRNSDIESLGHAIYMTDSSEAVKVIDIDSGFKAIRLVEFREPVNKSKAIFSFKGQRIENSEGRSYNFTSSVGNGSFIVEKIESASALVTGYCNNRAEIRSKRLTLDRNREEESSRATICGEVLNLEDIDFESFAKVRIEPKAKTFGETNLTVNIGIEKRAFELNPDKAKEKIENIDETIKKWEGISGSLGDVVKGMKAACFATSGVLTLKNFFSGLSGEAIARERVMRGEGGWTERCQQEASQSGISIDRCFSDHADDINKDVRTLTGLIDNDNKVLQRVTDDNTEESVLGGIFGTTSVNADVIRDEFISGAYSSDTLNKRFDLQDGTQVSVNELISDNEDGNKFFSVSEARDMKLWLDVRDSRDVSEEMEGRAEKELARIGQGILDRKKIYTPIPGLADSLDGGGLSGKSIGIYGDKDAITAEYYGGFVSNGEYGLSGLSESTPAQLVTYNNKPYLVLLGRANSGEYVVTKTYEWNKDSMTIGSESTDIPGKFRVFNKIDANFYRKKINNPEVRYYEQGDFKGLPAIVPFDVENGWYSATQQSLPGFGNIKAFESSGRIASFWLCHVGTDGNIDFLSTGFGDDECRQFNLNTGQALDKFPGLSEADTKRKVDDAVRALNEAAREYGKGDRINILGQSIKVGSPAASVPGTQCQDFMSPEDCKLLFNVCDPVICPISRCNFGGRYPVDDVIQSGIVGSVLLCLPNSVAFGGDVVVPVCLSGIKAGVDNYLSILEQHKACLQENIETGRTVGICDEIYSVYSCEFFWRQAAPLTKSILPKIVEFIYTGGRGQARGGGEYLTVQRAFDNTEDSIDYFTNYYAGNTFEAFRARSVEEAGSSVCRAFISAKAPTDFETLIEPDSPPQFSAFYSEIPYTDATVPATSQYKVFYHIFAGNDRGVAFDVYLKDPPESSYYHNTPRISVSSGFVAAGQSASETKDFTAPAGYKQLCVRINDKEECGFKQVSTSFALNYARDEILKGELQRTDIEGERECISGEVNPAALINPNIQEAGQEAIDPAIYNRGIVRICATSNPGTGTNPTRFVDVGYCADERIRCWLDKESVDNALTANNIGAKNETLTALNARAQGLLISGEDAEFLVGDRAKNAYEKLNGEFNSMIKQDGNDISWKGDVNIPDVETFAERIDSAISEMYVSVDKAKLMLMKGKIYEAVAMKFFKEKGFATNANKPGTEFHSECTAVNQCSSVEGPGDIECFNNEDCGQINAGQEAGRAYTLKEFQSVVTKRNDNFINRNFIFLGSENTWLYVDRGAIIYERTESKELIKVAEISDGKIKVFQGVINGYKFANVNESLSFLNDKNYSDLADGKIFSG